MGIFYTTTRQLGVTDDFKMARISEIGGKQKLPKDDVNLMLSENLCSLT